MPTSTWFRHGDLIASLPTLMLYTVHHLKPRAVAPCIVLYNRAGLRVCRPWWYTASLECLLALWEMICSEVECMMGIALHVYRVAVLPLVGFSMYIGLI